MRALLFTTALALATMAAAPSLAQPAVPAPPPAGEYTLDLTHTSVTFRVWHLGLSQYTARFAKVSGKLNFDPANPAAQSVTAVIDAASIRTDFPDPAKLDFDARVGKEFLEVSKYPEITFKSTKVEPTGPTTAKVTGDLTLHGVTKPVTLDATFNGGFKGIPMAPAMTKVGFSAHGSFKRSDFGIKFLVPPPGTKMGVGDEVDVTIEAEFTQP